MSSQGHAGTATDGVVEVTFSLDDPAYPFVHTSEVASCLVELVELVPRSGDRYAEFFTVSGADPARVRALAEEYDGVDASCLSEYEDGGLFEFVVTGDCPAGRLAKLGALPREVRGVEGRGRIVAEIPPGLDSRALVEAFLEEVTAAELLTKRETDSLTLRLSRSNRDRILDDRLTDRQREVLRAAYDAGYYEWPRESTGTAVAERLDITSATFSEHIHAAERKLLGLLFEDSA